MPSLEGGTQKSRQTGRQISGPHGALRPVFDLGIRALLGNMMSPQETDIPVPLQQAVSGYQDMMPTLMAQAFGQPQGLASRLSGGSPTSSGSSVPMPLSAQPGTSFLPERFGETQPQGQFGTQTREQLGLGKPSIVDPRFLPPTEDILENLPPVRTSTPTRRQIRQEAKLAGMKAARESRAEAGLGTRKLDQKIARKEGKMARRYYE